MNEYKHRCPQEQKGDLDHLQLELQLIVSYLTWDPSLGLLEGKNMLLIAEASIPPTPTSPSTFNQTQISQIWSLHLP